MRALVEGFSLGWQRQAIIDSLLSVEYWISNKDNKGLTGGSSYLSHDAVLALSGRESIENGRLDIPDKYLSDSFYQENKGLIDVVEKVLRLRKYQYSKLNRSIYKDDSSLRRFVFKEIAYWTRVLEKYEIEVVVHEAMPHTHYSYIIYYVAKLKNIKTIIFHRATDGVSMRFFLSESMVDLTPKKIASADKQSRTVPARNAGPPVYSNYGKENPWNQRVYVADVLKGAFKIFTSPKIFIKTLPIKLSLLVERLRLAVVRSIYRIEYNMLCSDSLPSKKYIYFPLHVRPEDSSYPVAGNFEDIVYCCEYIREKIDDDVVIAIKEHPNQRYLDGNMYFGYYHDLIKCENVILLNQQMSSDEIIDKCSIVMTPTGQAGWECLLKNKPAILFSSPWYQDFPYVFFVDDVDVMTLINGEVVVEKDEVDEFYNTYLSSTYPGTTNLVVVHALDISLEENIKSISCSINDKLKEWKCLE